MSESKRVQIILTDEMNDALEMVSTEQAANKSALVRLIIADWLKSQRGIEVDHILEWGGTRIPNGSNS